MDELSTGVEVVPVRLGGVLGVLVAAGVGVGVGVGEGRAWLSFLAMLGVGAG